MLTEEVYMIIPPGFDQARKLCQLNCALYGLRQASRAWYTGMEQFHRNQDLQRSNEDPNLFFFNFSWQIYYYTFMVECP
jgi:hypothetical protein